MKPWFACYDDEIGSKLGFDAAAAIASIEKLKRELDSYNNSLQKIASTTGGFNTEQAKADDVLRRMATSAQIAAGHLKELAGAQQAAASSATSLASAQQKNLIQKGPTQFQQNLGINPNTPAQSFGQTLGQADQQKQIQQLQATEAALRSISGRATQTGKDIQAGAAQGAAAANGLAVSWRTVIRVFGIQFAARAIASVVSAFTEGIKAAKDFELQLAEIQTISQEFESAGLAGVSTVVTRLSEQFGRPVEEVAKGLYQTLSNQIGNATESTRFLSDAMEFGVATLTTTADSVDLLSGVLNAYGLSAASTTRISDELFKTIELGRVTGTELANTYGRLTTLSSQLGVSTAQVNASLAVLTINGVKASDAMTQLSNLFLKLIQPSVNTRKALNDIGVASAEAGILAFGLEGFLEKLANGKTALSDVADLLGGRIRAIRGASTLLSQAEQLNADLLEIQNSAGATARAFALINGTNAQKLNQQLQQARNTVIDFGRSAIAVFVQLVDSVGGAKVAFGALTAVIGTLVGTALLIFVGQTIRALVSLALGLDLANVKMLALKGVVVATAVAAGAFAIAFLKMDDIVQEVAAGMDALQKSADIDIKIKVADALPGIQAAQAEVTKSGSIIEQQLNAEAIAIQAQREANIRANSDITADLANNLKARTDLVGQGVKALTSVIESSLARTKSLSQEINGIVQESFKNQFESQLTNLAPARQVQARLNAVKGLSGQAQTLSLSSDPAQQKQAVDFLKQAFDQVSKINNLSGFTRFGLRAENDLRNQAVTIEKNIAAANAKVAANAQTTLDREDSLTQQAKANAEQQTAVAVGVKNLGRDIENNTNNVIVFERQFAASAAGVNLSINTIGNSLGQLRNRIATAGAAAGPFDNTASTKQQLATADLVIAQFAGIGARAKAALVSGEKQAILDSQKEIAAFAAGLADSPDKGIFSKLVESFLGNPDTILQAGVQDFSSKFSAAAAQLLQARQAAAAKLESDLKQSTLKDAAQGDQSQVLEQVPQLLENLGQGAAQAAKGFQDIGEAAPVAATSMSTLQQSVDAFSTNNIVVQSSKGVAAIQALNAAAATSAQAAPAGAAFGRYFANGGFAPRGTDTIPAMLSPGEFVINAASSRRFFSQLTAMNAGVNPTFRASGGSVTNINIGDVNVNGGRDANGTATAVVNEIRRLRRRGVSNVNR